MIRYRQWRLIARALASTFGLIFFLSAPPALAWGNAGHRTVCEIAFLNLTPTAKAEVERLLQARPSSLAPDARNAEFSSACTYPDRAVAGGPPRRDAEHFVNYPRNTAEITVQSGCGGAFECVDSAIIREIAVLRSPFMSDQLRSVALIYLGHFVGDIHQPLHNSFADDRGGNSIAVSGVCPGGLHSAWDTCILVRTTYGNISDPPLAAVQQVAATWSAEITDAQRAQWLSAAPWQWSRESFAITTSPDIGYCIMVQSTCQYDATHPVFGGTNPRSVLVDVAYQNMAAPIIRQRISQAGVRLAHLINLALDPAYRLGL